MVACHVNSVAHAELRPLVYGEGIGPMMNNSGDWGTPVYGALL